MQCPAPCNVPDQSATSAARMTPASFSGRPAVAPARDLARSARLSAGRQQSTGLTYSQSWASSPPHILRFAPCLAGEIQGASCNIVREEGLAERIIVQSAATADYPAAVEFTWPGGFETRYEMGEVLGRGSFGTVRTAFDRQTGRTLAVKIIPKSKGNIEPERIYHRIREEVGLLAPALGSSSKAAKFATLIAVSIQARQIRYAEQAIEDVA